MHANSIAAYRQEAKRISIRAAAVYSWIREHGRATDREVMAGMGFTDPNKVRPRITELVEARLLLEVGEKVDPETRKTVRIVDLASRVQPEQMSLLEVAA